MDLVMHLPESRGMDAIFTIVDCFSKLVTFVPCQTGISAPELATLFFQHVICKFGMPRKIVNDRNSRFVSQFLQSLMSLQQCKVALSSGYHPQTDGQSERFHGSVEQMLRFLVAPNQRDWVSQLPTAEFALNSAVHVVHGRSPFEVVFGRALHLPLNRAISSLGQNKVAAISNFLQSQAQSFVDVLTALQCINEVMHQYANSNHHDIQFAIGDLVYVSAAHFLLAVGLSRKLAKKWVGSFAVAKVISPVIYCISLPADYRRIHPAFHTSQLYPHYGPMPSRPPHVFPLGEQSSAEYEVEDILDQRIVCGKTYYLVKWLGYPIFESTWELATHLANAPDIVSAFFLLAVDVKSRQRGSNIRLYNDSSSQGLFIAF